MDFLSLRLTQFFDPLIIDWDFYLSDVTGGNDGSVRMFEFGHPEQILPYRGPNVNDRVNRIRFNTLGNKVGLFFPIGGGRKFSN